MRTIKQENEKNINQMSEETKRMTLNFTQSCIEKAITRLILLMYKYDTEQLQKDLLKLIVLDSEYTPTSQEKLNLMRWLWTCIPCIYRGFDYSNLLDKVRSMNEAHATLAEIDDDVPFV